MKKLFLGLVFSLGITAEVPSDSDYAKHSPYFSLSDQVNDTLGQPRMILCFMSKLRPDLMATKSGQEYLALVNQAACDEAAQVSSGPQSSGGAASSSSNSQSTAISYTEVVVNAKRASTADPMIVKAWVPNDDENSSEGMMIYTYTEATAGVSEDAPFGEFLMRFTGTTLETSTDFFLGYLQASGSQLTYSEEFTDPQSGQTLASKAVINLGDGDTGNGAVSGYNVDYETGSVSTRTDVFAYNETIFCRKKVVQNGSTIDDAPEQCFLTDEAKGTKEVFGYFLFDSETGTKFDLPSKGFRVKYNNLYGFADGYGLHFDNETSNALTSGLTVVRDDDDASVNGLEYTTYFLGGKLIKKEVLKKTLASLSGLNFVAFLNSDQSLGISQPAEYKMNYNAENDTFTLTHTNYCGDSGCFDRALDSEISFTSSAYVSDATRWGIFGYMPGIGGLGISVDAMRSPNTALVTQEVEYDVSPANFPTKLYCVENCPTYTEINELTTALGQGSQAPNNGPYTNYNSFGVSASQVVTYTVNPETNVYSAGDGGDAVFGTLSTEVSQALSYSQFGFGAYSGALVTSLSELTCDIDGYDYCTSPVYSGAVSEYYQWVTGPDRWNQFRGLKDPDGRIVSFSRPLNVYFNAPNDADRFQEYAGKELRLQFGGGEQLWGIPGGCVYDGTFTEDCTNPDTGGYLPWVSKFVIRPSETTGRLYKNSGGAGDYYLTKPAFGIVILKKDSSYVGTLELGLVDDLPSLDIVNIGPNGGTNFIGLSPSKPSTVSVVHGLAASEATAFSEEDNPTTVDTSDVGDNAPQFTSPSSYEVPENTKSVGTLAATDADGDTVIFNITGFGASPFTVDSSSGAIAFREAPDFEAKSSYAFDAVASDGVNASTQSITVTVTNVNDKAPVITSSRWFNYNPEFDSIGSVTATDPEGDTITFSIDSNDLAIDSESGALSFVSSPSESSYSAAVTATDGVNSSTQIILVFSNGGGSGGSGGGSGGGSSQDSYGQDTQCISGNCQEFAGKAIDGYLIGAKVYIDQNFNFNWDQGEIIGTTDENGGFTIPVNDNSIYQCLANRPILVDVPVGAVDTSRGEVTKAYKMALPSINDAGTDSIIISPFTNLLSNAISKAKLDSGIKEDLSVSESCGDVGNSIATKISNEVSQIIGTIQSSLGVTYADLLTDFVSAESNQYISTAAAENLADFLPYFKQATDEIDQELTSKFGIPINTNLTIQRETVTDILENTPNSIEMNFFTVYKDDPNALGWFLEESVEARKGILNKNGTLTHAKCLTGAENCSTSDFNLNAIKDASNWYMKRSQLKNSNYNLDDDNWTLEYEESMYLTSEADGSNTQRRCNDQNWLYLQPKFNEENRVRNDRYNTGQSYGGQEVDSCHGYRDSTNVSNALFMRLVDSWTNPDQSGYSEDYEIGLQNSSFVNSKFLENKQDKIFENRDSLDVDPLIQEIKSLPRTIADVDELRARIKPGSGDSLTIYWNERLNNQQTRTLYISFNESREQDQFSELSFEVTDLGISTTEVQKVTGASATKLFRDQLIEYSQGFGSEEYVGEVNTISGKTIDGYISGAEIFIDKNFNFKKDGDEYTATTDENGAFSIDVVGSSYACLINRPIVANVPVGAIDSTLGEVTEAYQMILPSISDAGASTVVISPFSTIFSEAIIKGKEEAGLKAELSPVEACGTKGNAVAAEISKRITEVKTAVENTYGVSYATILSDFIESGSSGVVSETSAQNIATFFRPIKELQDNISSSMTSSLGIPITANITFEKEVIDSVFSGASLTSLPLDFYSVYLTEPNDLGWRREVAFRANGANVDGDGNINAFKCLDNPASDCISSSLTLDNLSIFSEDYRQTVSFYYGLGAGTQVSIGNAKGLMVVDASDVKYFFESEGQDRHSCGVEEQIQLRGDASEAVTWEYKYQTNYDEYNSSQNGCRNTEVDAPARRGSIEILRKDNSSGTSIGTTYVMPDMENTSLFSSVPKKLIENFETVNPKAILEEIATFPSDYYQLEAARARLSGKEELQYTWSDRYSNGDYKTQYQMYVYATDHPDQKDYALTVSNYAQGNLSPTSSASYQGLEALETFDSFIGSQQDEMSNLFYAQGFAISGEVVDGYISGAEVFIDQNFNFIKDPGELSARTFSDGSFTLREVDEETYQCLIKRPIVANVPVGAVDSTLGTVTTAYQMILPSITDAGTSAVVISPFTSLLSEAIIAGKDDSNLIEDLTVAEGCTAAGDAVAANITTRLNALTSSIEESFGISYEQLLANFLENSSNVLTEVRAQNIAKFFPYVKSIRDQIGSELTTKYGKSITPNLSLNQNALATIFGNNAYTNVPLEFYSLYKTNPNENGWYSVEQIRADGASLSNSGVLSRYQCLLSNSSDCKTTTLSLNNIGNASRSYVRTTSIYKDNFTAAGISGDVVIEGTESRGYRDNGSGGNQFFCENQERIQFNGSADSAGVNPEYRYGFGTNANDIQDCADLANYSPNLQLRVETQGNNLPNADGTAPVMALQFPGSNLAKTKLVNSKVFKIIGNDDINPASLINEVSEIPYKFSQLDELRALLIDQESAYFYYTPNTANVGTEENPSVTHNFSFSNDPQNDSYRLSSNSNQLGETLYDQAARDKIYEVLTGTVFNYGDHIGSAAPKNSVVFNLSSHQITATDKLVSGTERNYKITPIYDSTTGYIDASIVGSALSKASIDNFFDNNYTADTKFTGRITTSTPFTKEEDVTFEIFKGSNFSKDDDYFEIKVKFKIETLDGGGVKVSWLDDSIATFNFHAVADGTTVTISRDIPNDSGLDTWTIASGGYDFTNFLRLGVRWEQVLAKFSASEIDSFKAFFEDGGSYSWKINFGDYNFVTKFGGMSSILSGKFDVANTPKNAVYPEGEYEVYEGSTTNMCFNLNTPAITEESFTITPSYQTNKPGYVQQGEVTLSNTTVTFAAGSTQACVTLTGISDALYSERDEVLDFTMTNLTSGLVAGRQGAVSIILKEN